MEKEIGKYAFIVGVVVAVILGLAIEQLQAAEVWLTSLLVVLGLIVGFLNVSGKETKEFLWVTVALVLVAYAAKTQIGSWETDVKWIGSYLSGIFGSIVNFVVPASIVVGLREVWELSKPA